MKKSILFLLQLTCGQFDPNLDESLNGPLVGFVNHLTQGQDATFLDAEPYCRLNALKACTTIETAKLCSVSILFSNCKSITAYGENCDEEQEGTTC